MFVKDGSLYWSTYELRSTAGIPQPVRVPDCLGISFPLLRMSSLATGHGSAFHSESRRKTLAGAARQDLAASDG